MEVYIAPPEARPEAFLSREQVLGALAAAKLAIASATEEPGARAGKVRWVITFEGSDVRLEFQATDAGLVFATLDQSMFDESDHPDRICSVLTALGWKVDQENIG